MYIYALYNVNCGFGTHSEEKLWFSVVDVDQPVIAKNISDT